MHAARPKLALRVLHSRESGQCLTHAEFAIGSRPGRHVDHFLSENFATPPDIQDDEQRSKQLYSRITSVISPWEVSRDTDAFVNVDASTSKHPTPSVRRVSSLRLPRESVEGYRLSDGMPTDVDRFVVKQTTERCRLMRWLAGGDRPFNPQNSAAGRDLLWTQSRQVLEVEIQAARLQDHQTWQPDLISEEARLQRRLDKLKLDMQVVQGDGNCQFRSVSQALWGTQDYHLNVRQKAVGYMRDNRQDFEAFLGEGIDGYLDSMATPGTWGDELTLRATSDAYGILVNVLTSDQHNWFMRYKPQKMLLRKEVFLTYIAPVHYNAIRRRRAQHMLQRKLSRSSSQIQAALDKARAEERQFLRMSEGLSGQETAQANRRPVSVP